MCEKLEKLAKKAKKIPKVHRTYGGNTSTVVKMLHQEVANPIAQTVIMEQIFHRPTMQKDEYQSPTWKTTNGFPAELFKHGGSSINRIAK